MKVLTKYVSIEGEEFVLIQDKTNEGRVYFGTIPYTELDESGRMKRALNGKEISISFNNAAEALENRKKDILLGRLFKKYIAQYEDEYEALAAMVGSAEYEAIYA